MRYIGTYDTLKEILKFIRNKKKGVYLRFGDGDLVLAAGSNSQDQLSSKELSIEIKEALNLNGEGILKALPLHCRMLNSVEPQMLPGNHEVQNEHAISFIKRAEIYWGQALQDIYSPVALHYIASIDPITIISFLKEIQASGNIIFVGNEEYKSNILEKLFGCNFIRIKTPPNNSYEEIDRIEKDILKNSFDTYTILITAMGDAGRVLQKRLWLKLNNLFLFDFGSLLCVLNNSTEGTEWRAWYDLSKVMENKDIILKGL